MKHITVKGDWIKTRASHLKENRGEKTKTCQVRTLKFVETDPLDITFKHVLI